MDVAERLWRREHCQWLLIGGPEELLAELRDQLPKALRERLAGEIAVSLTDGADAILARVLAVEQATERRMESERVGALLKAALGHGPGVLGLDRTLEAIVERRVQILVVEEDFRRRAQRLRRDHGQTLTAGPTREERSNCDRRDREPDKAQRRLGSADQPRRIDLLSRSVSIADRSCDFGGPPSDAAHGCREAPLRER